MADDIRVNIKKHEEMKKEKYGDNIYEQIEDEDFKNEYSQLQNIEKSQAYLGLVGKPPKHPSKQPVYGFQKRYQNVKTKAEVQEKKTKSFA